MGKKNKKRQITKDEYRRQQLKDSNVSVYKKGEPLDPEELRKLQKEIAGEEYQVWGSNIFGFERWDSSYYEDQALKNKGIDYYKYLYERDDTIYKAIKARKIALTNRAWALKSPHSNCPKCDKMKTFIKMVLDNLGYAQPGTGFQHLISQMLSSFFEGWELHEVVYDVIERGDFAGKIAVAYCKHKNQHNYKLDVDKYDNIKPDGVVYKKEDAVITVKQKRYDKSKFIITQYDPEKGNPYGSSAINLRVAYLCFVKRVAFDFWGIKGQRYGVPSIKIILDNLADKDLYDKAIVIAQSYKNRAGVVLDRTMTLELVEAKTDGRDDIFRGLIDRCDKGILNCLNLTEYGADDISGSGAGRAVTKQHGNVRDEVAVSDGKVISETLNTQLIYPLCKINFPRMDLHHAPILFYPNMNTKSIKEMADIASKMGESYDFDVNELFDSHNIMFPRIKRKIPKIKPGNEGDKKKNNEKKLDK